MPDLTGLYPLTPDRAITAALILMVIVLALIALVKSRKGWRSHLRRKSLMTPNEAEFYYRLKRALPAYHVFPQVSFAAFLTDGGTVSTKARWSVRARFDRKMADYVICEPRTMSIVALVELDDSTHVASADRKRHAITKAAGYQTLRFQSRQKPSEKEIAALFHHAAAWNAR